MRDIFVAHQVNVYILIKVVDGKCVEPPMPLEGILPHIRCIQQHFGAESRADSSGTQLNLGFAVTDIINDLQLNIVVIQVLLDRKSVV